MKKIIIAALILFVAVNCVYAQVIHKDTKGFAYYLYLPSSYNPGQLYPLIIALHWSTGRGMDMIGRWKEQADKFRYIIAAPNSKNSAYWETQEDKDVIRMIKEIEKNYPIDKENIFATGFSGGATFSYHLGLTHPDIFKAIAPFSGSLKYLMNHNLKLNAVNKRIPVFIVHGKDDGTIDISESRFAENELKKYGHDISLREVGGLSHEYPDRISWMIINWFEKIRKSAASGN